MLRNTLSWTRLGWHALTRYEEGRGECGAALLLIVAVEILEIARSVVKDAVHQELKTSPQGLAMRV